MDGQSCLYYIVHECSTITQNLFAFLLNLVGLPLTNAELFYFFIPPPVLVWPWQSEWVIHHYLVRLDGIVLHRRLSMCPPFGMRCDLYDLNLFYNACNAEQRLLCFMIGCLLSYKHE